MSGLLQERIQEQARARPEARALVGEGGFLTYGELETRTNRLARLLLEAGCRRGDRVALFMPKCRQAVAGMLGVLKADCAYVPIDIKSPAPRVLRMLEASEPAAVLASPQAVQLLDAILELPHAFRTPAVIAMGSERLEGKRFSSGFGLSDLARQPADPLSCRNSPQDPAHLLFTSGSTGVPKGVVITHQNVTTFLDWAVSYFGIGPGDRNSNHTPLYFDLSTFDVYGTLSAGAELHLVPPQLNLLAHKLAEFIRSSELTQWFSVPSILTYLAKFDAVRQGDFPALKRLLWCGEVLPTPTLMYLMERLPHVRFTNLYGPTEATIASSYHTVEERPQDPQAPIPIGTACGGEELLVLDEELKPVPPGKTGDLYIAGGGLSPGYWRDPEKTRAAFLRRPGAAAERIYRTGDLARIGEDGLIYFLGRADTQVKSRGYRIELGEIEAALHSLEFLQESAVVSVEGGGFDGAVICCAFAPRPDTEVTLGKLRSRLGNLIPSYMLPSRWMELECLPRNGNGKIDRPLLRQHFEEEIEPAEKMVSQHG